MPSNSKDGLNKILAARNTKVQIDHLKFEIKQRDQKIEKLKQEIANLRSVLQKKD